MELSMKSKGDSINVYKTNGLTNVKKWVTSGTL